MQRLIVLTLAGLTASHAWAQTGSSFDKSPGQGYPDRPIRLVVPFPPGGNVDTFISGGYEPKAASPAEFRKTFLADIKRYAEIVRIAKIEAQ